MLCYYGDDMEEYRRWEDNIKMDLKEIGVNGRSWIDSAQDRDYWRALVNATLNLQVTQATELVNIPISSQLCYVTMETIWKNTGDGRTTLRWILKK